MTAPQDKKNGYWIITYKEKILCYKDQVELIQGSWEELNAFHSFEEDIVEVGEILGETCYLIDLGSQSFCEQTFEALSLRALVMQIQMELFSIVARAWQVALFLRTHKYCGQCGSEMTRVDWELATQCHRCKHRCYPRISPCIIVAIRHQDKILLAQGKHIKNKMYSTLAGFVESGETLEHAVHREVFEEVGLKIKNLRYFGSQPWPFPHSLMCGFLADYAGGDIKVDGQEILDAKWFGFDDLPFVPPTFSIAGQLIEATQQEIEE